MQMEHSGSNELTIMGNIKSIGDGIAIKEALRAHLNQGARSIVLVIRDSPLMTSTVVGFLVKLAAVDKLPLALVVGDARLYQLLDELNLLRVLNVRCAED